MTNRLAAEGPTEQDPGVTIYADGASARMVAELLRNAGDEAVPVALADPPEQTPRALARLVVRIGDGLVTIAVSGDALQIAGAPQHLVGLAASFDFFAENEADTPGHHLHVEHWESHPWLSAASAPVAIENWLPGRL